MRDILTVLAGLVLLVLTAALAVPPLVDWRDHRELIDRAISRATGMEVRSDGPLEVRILPSPRLRMDRLRLGPPGQDRVSLDAMFVKAEVALTPLLSGEIRFRDARIGRAEFRLPTGAAGDWRVPRALLDEAMRRRGFVFEDLEIRQLLLTTVQPETGRTDQLYAENVTASAGSPTGPLRLDGSMEGERFELSTGELGPDLGMSVKLGIGGAPRPRLDLDGRLELRPGQDGFLRPRLVGQAKLAATGTGAGSGGAAGAADAPLRLGASANLVAAGGVAELESVAIEVGPGGGGALFRLTGDGSLDLDGSRLALTLAGRRLDGRALLAALSGSAGPGWRGLRSPAGWTLALALRLDALAVGGDEDLRDATLRAVWSGERIAVERAEVTAPGETALRVSGEVGLGPAPTGRAEIRAQAQDGARLGRFLAGLGVPGASAWLLPGPLDASADMAVAPPVLAVRNLRLTQGSASVSGALRYTSPDPGARGRVDAQLALRGLDLARLPESGAAFAAVRDVDFGIGLDGRDLAYGASRNGRIAARLTSDGEAIVVDGLDVSDLAGAEARLSGRIAPGGGGRIEGRMKAARAAPLIDLFGPAWIGGAARLLPAFLREGALDVAVRVERSAEPGGPAGALRSEVTGTLAGGPVEVATVTADRVRGFTAKLATERMGLWAGQDVPGLRRPARLDLAGSRDGQGRLAVTAKGDLAGLALATVRPALLGAGDDRLDEGEVSLSGPDASAWAGLLGEGAAPAGPLPVALRIGVARGPGLRLTASGRVAEAEVAAEVTADPAGTVAGQAKLSRLSLPWLASALALHLPPPEAGGGPRQEAGGGIWPTGRFGAAGRLSLPDLTATLTVGRLDLGAGLVGSDAALTVATSPDSLTLRDLAFTLGGGRVAGNAAITRQGGLASLIGDGRFEAVPLATFLQPPFATGRMGGTLRFGGSGESVAAIVANLGGVGTVALEGLRLDGLAPEAAERAASRALISDDPLAVPRLATLLGQELGRGPLDIPAASGAVALASGTVRVAPLLAEGERGAWRGSAAIDLRTRTLDIRGALESKARPKRWTGGPPYVGVSWQGPVAKPLRSLDTGPLVNGLASAVLQRELERIEIFELDAAERARLRSRVELERARKASLEEAARQARLREEAAERARQEAERQRIEAERARAAAEKAAAEAGAPPPRPDAPPGGGGPLPPGRPAPEVRPPTQPGG